jgi:hypothetical protein
MRLEEGVLIAGAMGAANRMVAFLLLPLPRLIVDVLEAPRASRVGACGAPVLRRLDREAGVKSSGPTTAPAPPQVK